MPFASRMPRRRVVDRDADPDRPLARQPGDRHEAAHALGDLVDPGAAFIGAVLAEARDAAIDDARVDFLHRLVIDAEPVLDGRAEVLDDDIGLRGQLEEDLFPSGVFRSRLSERLLRCRFWKSGPSRRLPVASVCSPGISTLMTSAPQSASWRTAVGPARWAVRSMTVNPVSGKALSSWRSPGLAELRLC